MVTYSAPGVNEEDTQAFNAASRGTVPVTHYGGTIDGIPNTGERALSGAATLRARTPPIGCGVRTITQADAVGWFDIPPDVCRPTRRQHPAKRQDRST